jgi:putative flavoprotein involved in K+ transport
MEKEIFNTLVIGGGQAGLAAGFYLANQSVDFLILDENSRTGDSWRKRWDGLRLFTPSQFNNLPGMPFQKPVNYLPAKDEVASYLEEYAHRFNLPIKHDVRVNELSHSGQYYQVSGSTFSYSARNVIIATGPFQVPYVPSLANQLDSTTVQMHSSVYTNPDQVKTDSVLVVGAGNSGAEIALELVRAGKQVILSGRDVGRIPANTPLGKAFNGKLIWWFMSNILNVKTPIGRKARLAELQHGTPLGRATRQEMVAAGIELAPRLTGVQSGNPRLENGRVLDVGSVLWATGYRPDYSWVQLPVFDEHGLPKHIRGVVREAPGLYFLGLIFQTALNSSLIGGVGADAAYIVSQISYQVNPVEMQVPDINFKEA